MTALANNDWAGQPCVIVGAGASAGDLPWGWLATDWRMILASRAGDDPRLAAEADLWVCIDQPFWVQRGPFREPEDRAKRIWIAPAGPPLPPGLVDLELPRLAPMNAEAPCDPDHKIADGIATANNSGYAALHLAYLLGADPVYLLGFDCAPGVWVETSNTDIDPNQCVYDRWMASSLRLAALFAERGRRVKWINSGAAAPEEVLYGT